MNHNDVLPLIIKMPFWGDDMTKLDWRRVIDKNNMARYGTEPYVDETKKIPRIRRKRCPVCRALVDPENIDKHILKVHSFEKPATGSDSSFNPFRVQNENSQSASSTKVRPESLYKLSAVQFEELIRKLLERMDYRVIIPAHTTENGTIPYTKYYYPHSREYYAVQCKYYPQQVVGVNAVAALVEIIHRQPDISRGVLITSGSFSINCREYVKNKRVILVEINDVCQLLERHNVLPALLQKPSRLENA